MPEGTIGKSVGSCRDGDVGGVGSLSAVTVSMAEDTQQPDFTGEEQQQRGQETAENLQPPSSNVPALRPGANTTETVAYGPYAACVAGEPCCVCHEAFAAGEIVAQLPCSHCFHEPCVLPWLATVGSLACVCECMNWCNLWGVFVCKR
jgi:hypothetical protein